MNIKTMACAAFMVSAAFAAAAADKVWTGAGEDGKWSNPANWEGATAEPALADGDTVVFTSDSAATFETENNFDGLSLAAIVVLENCTVTVGGRPLTLSGATSGTYKNHCIYNRGTGLTLNVPLSVTKTSTIDFNGKSTTLNGDVTLADDVTLKFAHEYTEGPTDPPVTPLNFNGTVTGPNATLNVDFKAASSIYFNRPVTVKKIAGGNNWGNARFRAAGNHYEVIQTCLTYIYFEAPNAADPTVPFAWTTAYPYNNYGDCILAADQTIAGIQTGVNSKGDNQHVFAASANTAVALTLAPSQDCEAWPRFGTSAANGNISLVYAPTVDCTQTFHDVSHAMSGTITVKGGTLRTAGKNRFPNVPQLVVESGVFESARTNETTQFTDVLKSVRVGSTGTLRITSTCGQSPFADDTTLLTVNFGGKVEIGAGVTLRMAQVTYGGVGLQPGATYTSDNCDWIVGDGAVRVSDGQTGRVFWLDNQGGSWSEDSKWSPQLPTATDEAYVATEGASYTVGLDVPTLVPAKLFVENRDGAHETTLKVATDVRAEAKDVTVSAGGRFLVDGSTYAQTNGTFKVADGGLLEIVSGTFLFSDDVSNSKRFEIGKGGKLKMSGGTFEHNVNVSGNPYQTPFADGSAVELSGTAKMKLSAVGKSGGYAYCKGSLAMKDQSSLIAEYLYFEAAVGASRTNYVTVADEASIAFTDTPWLYCGNEYNNGGWLVLDFLTSGNLSPDYGYHFGTAANTILNIHGKARLAGPNFGFQIGAARNANAPHAVQVNVYDGGQIYHPATVNYADSLYGITVNDNASLNVGPGGVVTNGSSGGSSGVYGSHFLVGCGKADSQVVQTGGAITHQDRFQPVVGGWGGTGRWIVSNGVTTVSRGDFYVGGAVTNVLVSFTSGANGPAAASKWNNFAANAAKGLLRIAGGTFTCANDLWFSADGAGTLEMGPAADASLTAKDIYFTNTVDAVATSRTTVAFTFGPEGTGKAVASGTVTIAPGTKLIVDYSAYTGSKGGFDLISAAAIEGRFADEDVTFVGDLTKEHVLKQDGKRIRFCLPHGALLLVR